VRGLFITPLASLAAGLRGRKEPMENKPLMRFNTWLDLIGQKRDAERKAAGIIMPEEAQAAQVITHLDGLVKFARVEWSPMAQRELSRLILAYYKQMQREE